MLKKRVSQRVEAVLVAVGLCLCIGCARLPYTVETVHQDSRVSVTLAQEIESIRYSHPVELSEDELAAILRAFSIREQVSIPLRWFSEEKIPDRLFRENEIQELVPHLRVALSRAQADQRVAFKLYAPGTNPSVDRKVTSGWTAVRGPFLFLHIDFFHSLLPTHGTSVYEADRYATPPPLPNSYVLFFEPSRFWSNDAETGLRGVEYRDFLKALPSTGATGKPK
ncbi:MAG TPA: hypothetical protein VNI35_05295 [Nitrospira sp.]|nr:hypothetical protein [Nitrospira sp.]